MACPGACSLPALSIFSWRRPDRARAGNVEEYFYQTRGRRLTQTFSQGFQEKLTGRKWAEIPYQREEWRYWRRLPGDAERSAGACVFSKEVNTYKGIWRHPAKGSGQISEILGEEISDSGEGLLPGEGDADRFICRNYQLGQRRDRLRNRRL